MILIMGTRNNTMIEINNTSPFEAVHPGSILGEELKARGISQKEFAGMIGIQATHLSAIIHGTRNITPGVAAKLESGLKDIPAEMWLRLQNSYNVDVQRKNVKTSRLVSGYSIREMPEAALAEPTSKPFYGDMLQVRVTIPAADHELFELLAARLGWKIE